MLIRHFHTFSDQIITSTENENVIVMKLDLSSNQSIREFATEFLKNETRLDVLIHNAAVQIFRKAQSVDELELTMHVNHYGPFLLTHLIFPILISTAKTSTPRIIVVSSKYHHVSTFNPLTRQEDLNPINFWLPSQVYNNSKFCNIVFTIELARRLRKYNICANVLHPGITRTKIFRNFPACMQVVVCIFLFFFGRTPEESCQTVAYLAASPNLAGVSGKYFRNFRESRPNARVLNKKLQTILWNESKKLVKLKSSDPQI